MTLPENLERDGFQVTQKVFVNPGNTTSLDPVTKRKITIGNLFANHRLPIRDIVRLLDETYGHVVTVLLEQGVIRERRIHPRESLPSVRSRTVFRRM